MLAVQLTGIKQMALAEIEKPSEVQPDEVLIRLKSVGICGSDVHYYLEGRIGVQVVDYPFIVGHECSGIVEVAGTEVTHVVPGDLVAVDPAVFCGQCDQCKAGRHHTCRKLRFLGCPGQLEGCLTEYIVMPAFTCFPVTGKLDADEAALIEPLAIGVYSVRQAGISREDTSCAIFGAGPIGLSILMKLLADNVRNVGMVEPLDYRLAKAAEIGTAWSINPLKSNVAEEVARLEKLLIDVVFDASGEQDAIDNAIKILKPGGKLVLVGIPATSTYVFDMDAMRRKELTVINIRRQNHCEEEAIELVAHGKIDVKKMVTHSLRLGDTPRGFDMVSKYSDEVIKAMINL